MAVIAALLGAPAEDNHRLKALSDRLLHREDGSMAMPDDGRAAGAELYVYFSELIASRRKRPADDLTTALTQAEIVGSDGESERADGRRVVAFCLLPAWPAMRPRRRVIAHRYRSPGAAPHERSRLVESPDLGRMGRGTLAFDPPSHHQGRVTTHPISRDGEEIRRGRSSSSSTGRRIATTGRSTNRIASSPTAPSSDTWPSATASISASAPRWPGSKPASRSRNWYGGSRSMKSTWRGWSGSTRRTSVGSRRSRSPGDRAALQPRGRGPSAPTSLKKSGHAGSATLLVSRYSSKPAIPDSRPSPLCL